MSTSTIETASSDDETYYATRARDTAGNTYTLYEGDSLHDATLAVEAELIQYWDWIQNCWHYYEDGRRAWIEEVDEDGDPVTDEYGQPRDWDLAAHVEWDDIVEELQLTPVILIHPDPEVSYEDVGRRLWDLGYLVCTAVQTVDEARREWPHYLATAVIRLTADGVRKVPGFNRKTATAMLAAEAAS